MPADGGSEPGIAVARVFWTQAALSDVLSIESYIARYNPVAARRLAAELVVAADSLATFPERGRPGLEPGTRELVPVRPYVVIYRVNAGGERVWILRVLHGARLRGPGGTL